MFTLPISKGSYVFVSAMLEYGFYQFWNDTWQCHQQLEIPVCEDCTSSNRNTIENEAATLSSFATFKPQENAYVHSHVHSMVNMHACVRLLFGVWLLFESIQYLCLSMLNLDIIKAG